MALTGEKFLIDAYTGKGGFLDGSYLVPHPRESDEKFSRRKKLAVYPNYVKKVVDSYLSHLFKKSPVRSIETQEYLEFIQNVDKQGTYMDDYMRRAFKLSMVTGTTFLIVDKPKGKALTKLEEKQLGLTPYLALRTRSQLYNYSLDSYGRLSSITFIEKQPDGTTLYRYFDTNVWRVATDPELNEIQGEGEHNLGEVPVVLLHSTDPLLPTDLTAPPWILDIANLNFDLYNALSELRELFRNQTFSIFTIPVKDQADAEKLKDLTISTENAIPYSPEGGGKPDFIAPPPDPVQSYMQYIENLIQQIYRLSNLEFTGGVQKSGIAKEYDWLEFNRTLTSFAQQCEQAEYKIANLVCKWQGTEFKGYIQYPRDFSIRNLAEELETAMNAITAQILPPTGVVELRKKLSRDILGEFVDDKLMEQMDNEIEKEGQNYNARIRDEI
ncbi:phage portal protein [Desulfurobacterium thermolithotrophum]|uniref:phage portal protein n=1 Tax=Desulfurobacterium thermolithotrophum TaxID=64160 RepID=UPI0013D8C763|nr:phage portal protein [Desulfurobacterium thermolithotrophum]